MCQKCKTKPVYEFTNKRKLCKRCFINYFQKKVLYTIRKFRMIKNKDIVGYKKSLNFRDATLEDVLKMFFEKISGELVELSNKKRITKIAVSSTIDSESEKIVSEIINRDLKKINEIKPINKKIIKPLYLFLDKEVLLYSKLKKLKFKKEKKEKNKISGFINETEKKHPEVKRAIVKGFLKLG